MYQNFCSHFMYHCPINHHHHIAISACSFCRHIFLPSGSISDLKK